MTARTAVGIIGAGPAGLMLGNLLLDAGVPCVLFERHSRAHIEQRARAGVLEDAAVQTLTTHGLAGRLRATGVAHGACEFRFGGQRYTARYGELTGGRVHYVYPQQELVTDLVAAYLKGGGELVFDAEVTGVAGLADAPVIRYRREGEPGELRCAAVAGCDGAHGAAHRAIPAGDVTWYEYQHGHGWLAVLAAAPPSTTNIIYALHPDGFAGHMLRSPEVSRYYLQCPAGDQVSDWPDARIWEQLHHRLATSDGWTLREGPVIDKGVLDMRSRVCEPMQFGQLYLAGDAAHTVTPAGAKGMNLALGDAHELAHALIERYRCGRDERLRAYSATRLAAVWQAQEFTVSFLDLLHNTVGAGRPTTFADRLRRAALEQLAGVGARAHQFAENYVGPPGGCGP